MQIAASLDLEGLSRASKITIYKTLIIPVVIYVAEAWNLSKRDESVLGCFEKKILRVIFGPVCIDGEWRRRYNDELYGLYSDTDLVSRIKVQRLIWLGHVERMDIIYKARKVFESNPEGRRRIRGRPRPRWRMQVSEDLNQLGVRNWRQLAEDRAGWKRLLVEAQVHPGL